MVRAPTRPYRRAMILLPLRRMSITVATALAGVCIGAAPALASITDGTSNTIQVAVAATTIDQASHRVVIVGWESAARLTPGQRIRSVQLVNQRLSYTFENVMVESVTGTSSTLSLNFTKVEFSANRGCFPGVDTCLIESDGSYPPAT
jgi:hypothetical protein